MFSSALTKIRKLILDALFPPLCIHCAAHLRDSSTLCARCLSLIRAHETMFCPSCLRRLPENKKGCHKNAHYLLAPLGNYDDAALRALIHALKYKGAKEASYTLSALLARYVSQLQLDADDYLVIPIPLSHKRMRERGFNQAELIAGDIASRYHLEMRSDILCKIKHTPTQTGLSKKERKTNLLGCFELRDKKGVHGRSVILVDDVFTSGATMDEAARTLKEAGVKKIIALVLAKA